MGKSNKQRNLEMRGEEKIVAGFQELRQTPGDALGAGNILPSEASLVNMYTGTTNRCPPVDALPHACG